MIYLLIQIFKKLEKYNFRTTFLMLLLCFYVLVKTNILQKKQNHSKP